MNNLNVMSTGNAISLVILTALTELPVAQDQSDQQVLVVLLGRFISHFARIKLFVAHTGASSNRRLPGGPGPQGPQGPKGDIGPAG